jgi:conjugative transfer region protein TrbK
MKARLRFRRESAQPHGDAAGLLLRALTLAFVAAMIALAVLHQSRRDSPEQVDGPPASVAVDPLATELARCRTITPEQNVSDDTCRRVWAESRRRFFARSSPRPNAAANDPATAVPCKDQDRLPSAVVQPERGEAR